jgi:hypothetical protein
MELSRHLCLHLLIMRSLPRLLFMGLTFFSGSILLALSPFLATLGLLFLDLPKPAHTLNTVIVKLANQHKSQTTTAFNNVGDRCSHYLKYSYVLFNAESEASVLIEELWAEIGYIAKWRATFSQYLLPISPWYAIFIFQSLRQQLLYSQKHGASPNSSVNHVSANPSTGPEGWVHMCSLFLRFTRHK